MMFPDWLINFFNAMQCYHTERDNLGFYTDCEWKALAFFEAMFLIFFLIIIYPYHLWLKSLNVFVVNAFVLEVSYFG